MAEQKKKKKKKAAAADAPERVEKSEKLEKKAKAAEPEGDEPGGDDPESEERDAAPAEEAEEAPKPQKKKAAPEPEPEETFELPHLETVDHDHVEVERDKPPNWLILVSVLAICGVTLGMIIMVAEYFRTYIAAEKAKTAGAHLDVREIRALEEKRLGSYQWVSQKERVLRIPLDRAKELTLRDWKNRPKDPPPGAEPPPAPEPTQPAPAPAVAECDEHGIKSKAGEFYVRQVKKDKKAACEKCVCDAKDGAALAYHCAEAKCEDFADYDFGEADEKGTKLGKKKEPKEGDAGKDEPKKDEPKKDEPKKDEKKDEPKKPEPKKDEHKHEGHDKPAPPRDAPKPAPKPAPKQDEPY